MFSSPNKVPWWGRTKGKDVPVSFNLVCHNHCSRKMSHAYEKLSVFLLILTTDALVEHHVAVSTGVFSLSESRFGLDLIIHGYDSEKLCLS